MDSSRKFGFVYYQPDFFFSVCTCTPSFRYTIILRRDCIRYSRELLQHWKQKWLIKPQQRKRITRRRSTINFKWTTSRDLNSRLSVTLGYHRKLSSCIFQRHVLVWRTSCRFRLIVSYGRDVILISSLLNVVMSLMTSSTSFVEHDYDLETELRQAELTDQGWRGSNRARERYRGRILFDCSIRVRFLLSTSDPMLFL